MTERGRRKELRGEAIVEYKERIRQVQQLNRNDDPINIQEVIKENLERGDELYTRVKRKLDGTAVDARHIKELLNLCEESSKRINATSKQFDLKKTIQALMRDYDEREGKQLSKQEFVRFITEEHVNKFLLRPPTFEFFYGALKSEDLEIKVKTKKAPREKMVATQAVTAKERNMEVDVEQDTTPKEVEHINEQINRLTKDKTKGIPFFKTLVDPNSFTLTVENIFHTSFLIKEGKIGLKRDVEKNPIIVLDEAETSGNESILSFSMKDYQNWISD